MIILSSDRADRPSVEEPWCGVARLPRICPRAARSGFDARGGRVAGRASRGLLQCDARGRRAHGHQDLREPRPASVDDRRRPDAGGQRPRQPRDPERALDAGRPPVPPQPRGLRADGDAARRASRSFRGWAGARVFPARRAIFGSTRRPVSTRRPGAGADGVPGRRRLPQPQRAGARGGGVRHPDRRRRDAADGRRLRHARRAKEGCRSSAASNTTASPTPMCASCWKTCCRSWKPRSAAR